MNNPSRPHDDVVAALRSRIDGQVLTAGEPGYDQARTPTFPVRVGMPVAVVRPKHTGDVASSVDVARRSATPLFVRSGGHSGAAHSTGDGILLDLGSLTGLDVDLAGRTAWADAGLTAGAVAEALAPHGLTVGFGDTGSVGIGGITLGGGIGFLSRLHGMTIDNLLAAEIVTADGRVRTIDTHNEPDLFWAIRGGGGNFGVVTKFRYQLSAVPQVHGGPLILPATPEAIARLAGVCAEADDALTVIANVMPTPPIPPFPSSLHGEVVIMARVCYAGDPELAEEALRPLREVASPILDLIQPMPYTALFDDEAPYGGHVMAIRTIFAHTIDAQVGATILEHLSRSQAWLRFVQLRVLGGAISRVGPHETSYAHRTSKIMVNIACAAEGDRRTARLWTAEAAQALDQGCEGAYVNFFGPDDGDRIQEAFPEKTLDRLQRIKAAYDPMNLFSNNDNIPAGGRPPATSG